MRDGILPRALRLVPVTMAGGCGRGGLLRGGLLLWLWRAPAGPRLVLRDGGQRASLAREGVIEAVERLAEVPLVNIAAVIKETSDAVANMGGGEGRVLALKVSMLPNYLRVADGVGTRRGWLELALVHGIVDQPGGLERLNNLFSHGCGQPVLVDTDADKVLAISLRVVGP